MSRSNGFEPHAGAAQQSGGFSLSTDPQPGQRGPQAQAYPQQHPGAYTDAYGNPNPYAYPQGQPVPGYGLTPQQPAPAARAATGQAQGYAPKFDAYVPQSQGQPAQGLYRQPVAPAATMQQAPQPDLRGGVYDQHTQAAQQQQQYYDPRAYDLSQYNQPAQYTQGYAPQAVPQQQAYGQQDAYGYQQQQQQVPQGYGQQQGYAQDQGHGAQHQVQEEAADEYEDEAYDDDAPRRSRSFMIAAALAGAIFVGGGLTYAYNSLLGGGANGPTPVVKSASSPSKIKPSEPGGKQFAHSDSKVLGRLSENTSSSEESTGAKKVSTLVVKPDGSIEPPAAAPTETVTATMPGMSVVNVGGPMEVAPKAVAAVVETASTAAATEVASAGKPLVVTPPVVKPVKIAAKAVNSVAASAADIAPAAVAAAPVVKKEAPKKVEKVAALAPAAPAAAAPTVATGTGYMAVVASMPATGNSKIAALSRWADMQQKYGTVLTGKQPDVQEANLGDKGTYHRLLVGPPGSKDGANSVCAQLKAAGHTDCWVMAF